MVSFVEPQSAPLSITLLSAIGKRITGFNHEYSEYPIDVDGLDHNVGPQRLLCQTNTLPERKHRRVIKLLVGFSL